MPPSPMKGAIQVNVVKHVIVLLLLLIVAIVAAVVLMAVVSVARGA